MRCSQCNVILPPEVVILQLLLIGPVTHNCHTPAKGRNWTKISPDTHSWLILRSVWRIDQGARAVVSCTSIIHADIMFGNVTRVEKKKKDHFDLPLCISKNRNDTVTPPKMTIFLSSPPFSFEWYLLVSPPPHVCHYPRKNTVLSLAPPSSHDNLTVHDATVETRSKQVTI